MHGPPRRRARSAVRGQRADPQIEGTPPRRDAAVRSTQARHDRAARESPSLVVSNTCAPAFHEDRVAPDAAALRDAFAVPDLTEAAAALNREARDVFPKCRRLQRPDAVSLG